jgi:hypothetical protein
MGNGGDLTILFCVSAAAECDKQREYNIGTEDERQVENLASQTR